VVAALKPEKRGTISVSASQAFVHAVLNSPDFLMFAISLALSRSNRW
jgi:hypothetical protein